MRPNVSSGCCTLENAANAASIRNSQVYPLPPGASLHTNPHSHHHQQSQQQPNHLHHIHSQQHFSLQQQFKPQAPTGWFPPQSLYNAVAHPSNAGKGAANGRHQGLYFVAPQPAALIHGHGQQQQPQLIAAAPPPHSHQPHQYQPYQCSPQQQQQQQSTHFPQKSQCVLQSTSTVSGTHHFNGYLPTNPPHTRPPPDQLNAGAFTAGSSHTASFTKLASTSLVNQQRVNECAGIPLISNATTHLTANQRQRVQRKLSRSPAPHQKLSAVGGVDANYKSQHPCAGLYMARSANAASCSHISQLAAHAQGAPLLLNKQYQQQQHAAPKWPGVHITSNTFQSAASPHCSLNSSMTSVGTAVKSSAEKAARATLRYQHSAPAALSSRGKDGTAQTTQDTTTSSETTKDNTEAGDTALPRIIKPRKRRKKDRKPTTNAVSLKLDAITASGAPSEIARNCSQETQIFNMQQSQLMSRQPQELPHLQHKSHLYPRQDSNENLYKFINFYNGTQHPMESTDSTHVFNSNLSLLDYKPRGLLPSPCLKSPRCLSGMRHKQCDTLGDEHNICFCRDCDPLRSIWDYPLRRSLSDSSAGSIRTHSSSSSSSSSSQASSTETASSSCSSVLLTDNALSPSTAFSRAHRVGVIGSNRNGQDSNRDSAKRADKGCEIFGGKTATNGCLSDSNDSGYGDILSGINIADDFFSQSTYNMSTALTPLLATTNERVLDMGQSAANQSMKSAQLYDCGADTLQPLLPATADALLTESINEISRKLIETCGSELPNEFTGATTRSQSAYSRCSSDFSADSGIDSAAIVNCDELVFKFDNLNFMIDVAKDSASDNNNNNLYLGSNSNELAATEVNSFSELLKLPATASATEPRTEIARCTNKRNFFNDATNMNLLFDLNNNINSIFEIEIENEREREREQLQKSLHEKQQQHDQQFINNCFDLVWPLTFENCMRETVTKILDMDVEKQLGARPHPEIA